MMEATLFGSRSLSSMILSRPFLDSSKMFKSSPQLCSCRDLYTRASSYSRTSTNETTAISQDDLLDSYSCRINGSSSSLFLEKERVLKAFDDEYEGIVINPDQLPSNSHAFALALRSSLNHWRMKGKKGVWLKLPLEKSDLVPIAVQEGFEYHHAERSYVMMTYWIPDGPCLLPSNASHHVGVGSFVINDKNEVETFDDKNELLVVQEKHSTPELRHLWKIPTGFILESEEIYTGAVREVKEETGIDTEFIEVVAFRQVCDLIIMHDRGVLDFAKYVGLVIWMPLDEFVKQPLIKSDDMFKKIIEICIARLGRRYCGLSVHQLVSRFDGKLSSLYFNMVEDDESDCPAN